MIAVAVALVASLPNRFRERVERDIRFSHAD
jgi:hypothetical protein